MKRNGHQIHILITGKSPMDCQMLSDATLAFSKQPVSASAATSVKDVFQRLAKEKIDVVLLSADLRDKRLAGLQMLRRIRASYPETRVIVLFDPSQNDVEVKAFCRGARGIFCRSETDLGLLRECIDAVSRGGIWTNGPRLGILLEMLHRSATGRAFAVPKGNSLTKREQDVAKLVAEGLQSKEIAKRLGISEQALSNYLFVIYSKLGLSEIAARERSNADLPERPRHARDDETVHPEHQVSKRGRKIPDYLRVREAETSDACCPGD